MIRPTLFVWALMLLTLVSGLACADEPIAPLPPPQQTNPRKVALGERLFADKRLSVNDNRSCATCHDLKFNGATRVRFDKALDGSTLPFNTPTVFNSALNFRSGWEGLHRTLEAKIAFTLSENTIMNCPGEVCAQKLNADPEVRNEFIALYGRGPDVANIVDALATFEKSLITTGSRFDRWLGGETNALTEEELAGYHLFKSLGCIACHQGMMVGGNLFQRHGIFHPLARPDPEILRVPSLRNVAITPPYFHDGSAPTLQIAVRQMAFAQLNSKLTDPQVDSIVSFLQTLTGTLRGKPLGVP